jgi:hypothetical protein
VTGMARAPMGYLLTKAKQLGLQAKHCPASHRPGDAQLPQEPPHPSSPQVLPEQLGEQETHVDTSQASPVGQLPHGPPHPSSPHAPAGQFGVHVLQVPATHLWPWVHASPQVPQLVLSTPSWTHLPLQQLPPLQAGVQELPTPESKVPAPASPNDVPPPLEPCERVPPLDALDPTLAASGSATAFPPQPIAKARTAPRSSLPQFIPPPSAYSVWLPTSAATPWIAHALLRGWRPPERREQIERAPSQVSRRPPFRAGRPCRTMLSEGGALPLLRKIEWPRA